jgi:transcriptional regulator with XRE-family HTH domain
MNHKEQLTTGECLALWRRRQGLTKTDAAKKMDIPLEQLNRWENEQPLEGDPRLAPSLCLLLDTRDKLTLSPGEWCWLKRRREGMTLEEVAHESGLSLSAIQAVETNRSPKVHALVDWWAQ